MEHVLKTVVIPAAGLGTRVKSISKYSSKEMLLYNDLPLIEHAIYEAARAGFTRVLVVSSKTKKDLNQYLTQFPRVEVVMQPEPLGLGHAVLCTRSVVKDPYFGIILPDGVPFGDVLPQLLDLHNQFKSPGLAVMPVTKEMVSYYGIIDPVRLKPLYGRIKGIIEKPDMDAAPSNLGIIGRVSLLGWSWVGHMKARNCN